MCFEKDWIDVSAALGTPAIALAAFGLGLFNYLLAKRRRKDELFDRRYEFYKEIESWWRSTGDGAEEGVTNWLDWDELEPWAQEAEILFGKDVAAHIRSYAGKGAFEGIPWVPDYKFSKPFLDYLKL